MKRSPLVFIFITMLIDTIGFGIIIPVLPGLLELLTGQGVAQAAIYGGWLAFTFAILQFFSAPVLGNLSDRFGRRVVLLASLFCFGCDYLIMGFAPNLAWLFVGRALAGAAGAAFMPAYAYIADISPPEKRAQNFGIAGAAFGFGFILGPAIGGLLGVLGPRAPFFAAGALALANFAFGFFTLPESLPESARRPFEWKRANPLGTLIQLRKYPVVFGLCGAMFLWQLAHQVLPSSWSFYTMLKFRWSPAEVGWSLAFVGIIMAISQGLLTRRLIPRMGERRAVTGGCISAVIAYLGYAFATQGWMMYAFLLLWFMGAMVYPSMQALMSQQIPANAQGELQGGVASLYSLSSILGPPLMNELLGYFSGEAAPVYFPGAGFFCAALLTCVTLAICMRAARAPHAAPAASPA